MSCYICGKKDQNFILLPEKDEHFHIPTHKDTYVLLNIDNYCFLYYVYCNDCMTMYLDNYPIDVKKLRQREINGK